MDISKDLLSDLVRSSAETSLERVQLALALVGADWLIDVFVEAARADGVPWAELAEVMGGGGGADTAGPTSHRSGGGAMHSSDHSRRSTAPHEGKYRPLWEYLGGVKELRLTMSFNEVERVLGFPLPPSSRHHQPHWYGYKGSAVARAIIDAGWKAQNVDLVSEHVTFAKVTERRV